MKQYIVTHQLRQAQVRTETFLGRTFRVIPAVLVRSQVLRNNLGATLLPADAITDEWAALWNNIPVLVGPHPAQRGQPISGRSPELLNERGVGYIFRARAEQEDNGSRRLVGEVWIDEARVSQVPGLQEVLDSVNSGRPVELSTGFAVAIDQSTGTFQGEQYEAILRPAGADHLVISTEMTGACSVTDGCGLGVNKKETKPMEQSKGPFAKLLERATALLERKPSKVQTAWEENVANVVARELEALNQVTPSDQEHANQIRDALQSKLGTQDKTVVICDVYSTEKYAVFWFMTPFGPEPAGSEYFRVEYTEGEGGAYNFGEPVRVRRMTVYEPVAQNATAANAANKTPCGCHSEGTNMDANERKGLVDEMTAAFNSALKPVVEKVEKIEEVATNAATKAVEGVKSTLEAAMNELKTQVTGLATAVNAERDKERQALITALSANAKTKGVYSAADLEAMPVEQLRKVAQLAQVEVTTYAGRGGPQATNAAAEEEVAFAEPKPYWVKNEKNGASGAEGK